MNLAPEPIALALPAPIETLLVELVRSAQTAFQDDLKSVLLFGSGAEGRLRPNLRPEPAFRSEPLRQGPSGCPFASRCAWRKWRPGPRRCSCLLDELAAAAEAFAVKFDDIGRRHRVLYGENVLARLATPRLARKQRLCQVLLNLTLRLRERYAALSLREEQLAKVIAEAAGPLRSAAATLLDLEHQPPDSPKAALERVAKALGGRQLVPGFGADVHGP